MSKIARALYALECEHEAVLLVQGRLSIEAVAWGLGIAD